MSAGTLTESDAKTSAGGPRLGSFLLGRRIDEGPSGRRSAVVAAAVGVAGTPYDGQTGIVRCAPITAATADAAALAERVAAGLQAVRHPAIIPILEAGVAGEVAFVVEAKPSGSSIADYLTRGAKVPPTRVAQMVAEVAAGLTLLHGAGLTHGRVTPAAVWLSETGGAMLTGFALGDVQQTAGAADPWSLPEAGTAAPGPAGDQFQLAVTAAAAMTGAVPSTIGGIRDSLPGVPGTVVAILARATAPTPEERYPSLDAFAQAFTESIGRAGDDLIAGVWEAIGRRDDGMAAIMLDMAQGFAPEHPDLAMLRLRMRGGAGVFPGIDLIGGLGSVPAAAPIDLPMPSPLAAPTTFEEAAIVALLTPPSTATPVKKNPWAPFAMGMFVCLVFLVVVVVVTLMFV